MTVKKSDYINHRFKRAEESYLGLIRLENSYQKSKF